MRYSILFLYFFLIIFTQIAYAHRINVFCYTEDNKIKCSSKFSTGSFVKNGDFKVYIDNKLVYEGKGDDKGNFIYPIPDELLNNPKDIKIECIAEMGHKNYWIVKKDGYVSNIDENKVDEDNFFEEENYTQKEKHSSLTNSQCSIDINKLEKSFKTIVSAELAPIKRELAELKEPKVSVHDILSGIGYILGLMGIVLYFKSRNK